MAPRLKTNIGLTKTARPMWPSESGYIAQIRAQMNAVTKAVESIVAQFEDATPEIIYETLEPTFEKSQVYVPKKTGDLKDSGYLEIVSRGKAPYVEIGYAKGGKPRYAVYVHEIPYYNHEAPTRAKFLESAMLEDLGTYYSELGARYGRFMSG